MVRTRKHRKNWKNSLVYLENKAWRAGHKAQFFFTNAWEQRKLGEIADIVGGGTPSTSNSDYWDGEIDWYAPAEIVDQIFVNSSARKITNQGFSNSSAKMLPVGTVLFTSRAGIGKTAILSKEGCTNQGFQSIIPHENELDSYFIFSRTEELKRYGETTGAGSTFVEVSGKQMANMKLMMPKTMKEQIQIGSYFQNLDNLITLHQRKCENFKIQCCQNCFLNKIKVCLKMLDKFKAPGNNEMIFSRVNSISETLYQ